MSTPLLPQSRVLRLVLACTLPLLVAACARPYVQPALKQNVEPALHSEYASMEDGYRLPLRRWAGSENPAAVVLAVHGLNDYSRSFDSLGRYLSAFDITLIAYDQRGFGATEGHGLWHGSARLTADLVQLVRLSRQRYPRKRIYLLGESMGGAVVLNALGAAQPDVDGIILVAPAVWSRSTMPAYQRAALWMAAHTFPGRKLTGKGLDLKPSDNIDMLRALARDPMVIKATRVDVLYGVTNLMDSAMAAAAELNTDVLLLYGAHDDNIPRPPTCRLVQQLRRNSDYSLKPIYYPQGYHMLTRDLQAAVVWHDIGQWVLNADHEPVATPSRNAAGLCPAATPAG